MTLIYIHIQLAAKEETTLSVQNILL